MVFRRNSYVGTLLTFAMVHRPGAYRANEAVVKLFDGTVTGVRCSTSSEIRRVDLIHFLHSYNLELAIYGRVYLRMPLPLTVTGWGITGLLPARPDRPIVPSFDLAVSAAWDASVKLLNEPVERLDESDDLEWHGLAPFVTGSPFTLSIEVQGHYPPLTTPTWWQLWQLKIAPDVEYRDLEFT